MTIIAIIMMIIAMGVTLGVLFMGLFSMVRGGAFNEKWGNRLMRYRVVAQACAIILFFIALSLLRSES